MKLSLLHVYNIDSIFVLDPDDGVLAQFIHSDADPLVRATQVLAIISYSLFAESSLQDVVTGMFILIIFYCNAYLVYDVFYSFTLCESFLFVTCLQSYVITYLLSS